MPPKRPSSSMAANNSEQDKMPPKRQPSSMTSNSSDIRHFFKPPSVQPTNKKSPMASLSTAMNIAASWKPPAVGNSPSNHSDSSSLKEHGSSADSPGGPSIISFPPIELNTSTCPFKAQGEVCNSHTFKDLTALANHCRAKHPGRIIVNYEDDPVLQDGTNRIPCRRACGSMFSSYQTAHIHSKQCRPKKPSVRDCPWPECAARDMNDRAYGTHADMHVRDSRGLYQCSKCENKYNDIYLLASHHAGCKGEEATKNVRFDGVYRHEYQPELATGEATHVLAVARASSRPPSAWKAGQEHLADGIPIFTKSVFSTLADDNGTNIDVTGTLIALYDVHTSCVPTGKYCQAHTTIDPSIRSYYARAYKFTNTVDKSLEDFAARGIKPFVLSIGLDGLACKVDLILPWLKRSPPFTLIIRETELVYGMKAEYFPRQESGFHYGLFESHDLLVRLSADTAVDDAIKNLLDAWRACQDWKDSGSAHNGRSIGRNGDPKRKLKKAKRGSKMVAVALTGSISDLFEAT